MRFLFLAILLSLQIHCVFAGKNIVNLYAWAGEFPAKIIKQFEQETGIKVNYTSFESPEVMLTKIRTSKNAGYDIAEPGSLLVRRMLQYNMLEPLDKSRLPNIKYLDPYFLNLSYDPKNEFTIPFYWGITGIFVNTNYYDVKSVERWSDLFNKKYVNQLMLLDDAREVFAMSLLILHHSLNERNPEAIQNAYLKIKELMPNVKLFNSDAVHSILIDEDATIGMSWNGDLYKAWLENPKLAFIIPKDGFEFWIDTFVILKNAPHRDNAYLFLNFLLRPEIAKQCSLTINYATSNLRAYQLMPASVRNNPILYPSKEILKKSELQLDVGDEASGLFEKYWELLKMGG